MKKIFRENEGKGEKVEEFEETQEWGFLELLKRKMAAFVCVFGGTKRTTIVLDKILLPTLHLCGYFVFISVLCFSREYSLFLFFGNFLIPHNTEQ